MKNLAKFALTFGLSCVCLAALNAVATQAAEAQGGFQQAYQHIDLKIQGGGYFQVTDPTGQILYTRVGDLSISENGQFVVGNASAARPLDPAVSIPTTATSISIEADGRVSVTQAGIATKQEVGIIQLASFDNPQGLSPLGDNLFEQTDASGQPDQGVAGTYGFGSIQPVCWKPRTSSPSTK
jgi:flagellar basal-body rod protein FlgG